MLASTGHRLIGVSLAAGAALAAFAVAPAAAAPPAPSWVGTWGASALAAGPALTVNHLDNQTVREIVYSSTGGDQVRIRVSNAFGATPVNVGRASIALQKFGAQVSGLHPLTFGGRAAVTIAAGATVLSDPVAMQVPPVSDLAVSLYVPGDSGPATSHFLAQQTNYLASGNQAMAGGATAFTTTVTAWYLLDSVLVSGTAPGTVVALGDSITDGDHSQSGANMRWPNALARRLVNAYGSKAPGVMDEGIAGNRVLNDSACLGISAEARLEQDVLSQPALKDLILMEGINDIGFSSIPESTCTAPGTDVSAAQIIAGYQQIIARVHAAGAKIYGATMTPWRDSTAWTPAGERKRAAVNRWIKTSGAFDGVIDFASVVAAPGNPQYLDPKYDSGDHIHPNDAGYQAMGDSIDLELFAK